MPMLVDAPWDSSHFGHPVCSIPDPDVADDPLRAALDAAVRHHVRLVYWSTAGDRPVSPALLRTYAGRRVDRKATFRSESITGPEPTNARFRIMEQPRGPASTALLELAVTAGWHSRFRVDPGIPRERFEALYRVWMDRSTRGELADVVLVAAPSDDLSIPAGMVTVELRCNEGVIGLIAVGEAWRGQGVGRLLIESAHRWMSSHGCTRASVVTQLDNAEACRLYERCGYRLSEVRDVYHFWPTASPRGSANRG